MSWDEAKALADEALIGALRVARTIVEDGELPDAGRGVGLTEPFDRLLAVQGRDTTIDQLRHRARLAARARRTA